MSPPSTRPIPTDTTSSLVLGLPRTPHASYTSQTPSQQLDCTQPPHMNDDITRAAMEDFRQLFDMFDENGDQRIDSTEFANIVRMLGHECPSSEDLEDMIRVACERKPEDATPTSLTFPQFMRFFAIYKQDWPTRVSDADVFNVLDEDHGGTITPKELWKVLNRFGMRVSEDEANAMADFATPLPGPNQIGAADMAEVAVRVRQLRETKAVASVHDYHYHDHDDDDD